jgi:hypothetical protein
MHGVGGDRMAGSWSDMNQGSRTGKRTAFIEHSVQELVSQRIHGLVLGYEDLNDHDHLRLDPIHGLIAGKSDPLGQDRILERDKGKALARKTHKKASKAASLFCKFLVFNKLNFTKRTPLR